MKHIKLYLIYPVLLFLFLLSLAGCGRVSKDEAFEHWCQQVFVKEISKNTLNLHYTLKHPESYGITSIPVSLGNYNMEELETELVEKKAYLAALSSFDASSLSLKNHLTYDILSYELEQSVADSGFFLYQEPLGSVTGIQAELPILLSEYRFDSVSDIPVYLNLLAQVEDYFDSVLAFEEEKAKKGLFMPRQSALAVIAQCKDFVATPTDNMLLSTFESRLDTVLTKDSPLRETYIKENHSIFYGSILPAYEKIITTLTTLMDTSRNENGLCYLPYGKQAYEANVQSLIGCKRTIPEIKALIQKYYKRDLLALKSCLKKSEIVSPVLTDTTYTNPEAILSLLSQKITLDFPEISQKNYQVKYVDDSLKEHISPAFYLTPPIDNDSYNVIYINPAMELKDLSLFTTLAHEGYPGHLYQTVFSMNENLEPIRSLLSFGGYTEGWATYGEMYAYRLYGLDENSALYYMYSNSLNLSLYGIADIGIHYDGWQQKELTDFFSQYGITDETSIQNIQTTILEAPGNYLKYYIGYLEFLELKEKAQETTYTGAPWDLKTFHTAILKIGEAPFPVIEKYLPEYYLPLYSSK